MTDCCMPVLGRSMSWVPGMTRSSCLLAGRRSSPAGWRCRAAPAGMPAGYRTAWSSWAFGRSGGRQDRMIGSHLSDVYG